MDREGRRRTRPLNRRNPSSQLRRYSSCSQLKSCAVGYTTMSSPVAEITSTIQSASINRHPSPTQDINPSTAASTRKPVDTTTTATSHDSSRPTTSSSTTTNAASISSSALNPRPHSIRPQQRRSTLPPLPDLRFEQSYLASLKDTKTTWDVIWITGRDQVFFPLIQGTLWTLCLSGWRYWNRASALGGEGMGARVRRWWWGVNGWTVPGRQDSRNGGLKGDTRLAGEVGEFYKVKLGSGGGE